MTRFIAISNRKGGSGKTTTAVNVSAALAHDGQRVLVIDADPQAHTTLSYGLRQSSERPDLCALLTGASPLPAVMAPTYLDGLKVIPSSRRLIAFERKYIAVERARTVLADRLAKLDGAFDYVIFDTPPTLSLMTVVALVASHEVFVPMQTHFLALEGMAEIVTLVRTIKRRYNPQIRIKGVIPTFYQERNRLSSVVIHDIQNTLGKHSVLHPVRANVALAEAPGYGKTIFQYNDTSNGAHDYRAVAKEIEARG